MRRGDRPLLLAGQAVGRWSPTGGGERIVRAHFARADERIGLHRVSGPSSEPHTARARRAIPGMTASPANSRPARGRHGVTSAPAETRGDGDSNPVGRNSGLTYGATPSGSRLSIRRTGILPVLPRTPPKHFPMPVPTMSPTCPPLRSATLGVLLDRPPAVCAGSESWQSRRGRFVLPCSTSLAVSTAWRCGNSTPASELSRLRQTIR